MLLDVSAVVTSEVVAHNQLSESTVRTDQQFKVAGLLNEQWVSGNRGELFLQLLAGQKFGHMRSGKCEIDARDGYYLLLCRSEGMGGTR